MLREATPAVVVAEQALTWWRFGTGAPWRTSSGFARPDSMY